ncbi:zinc-binding alcohol dehydrogenase family protein [Burkholderia multivorans]|uniref:zinc-binding alcohol dehydrogenase family protein n=1 Tax=Burkholderia multivorans TaxID=87883 RepID=UPI000D009E1B|nr:zinc-binding alcohol dehydrogenase family protein [Burkholderia multivorans]AYY98859.1 zinc-binding alcohol dehydrogenase family protein [Burkholderia multivorans]MBU9118199.1 zinc-binding alcohol dehydrogenase family protein [Burkholderia multivorans]MCA8314545.1 zinc-binding alcohol dehydrogenase family protein [Burkholderia multivorans]MDN7968531.1 zinc-binding alcohol dehydrogenase family protein [Burkholderia multivorans]PRF47148.1 zinc-binding alcohol dehydrogenase family protein [Bur
MKAVGLTRYLPIDDPQALLDVELPQPVPGARDVLVKVEAISVNPVDTKVRAPKPQVEDTPRVLGWDAAGTVVAVGADVTLFKPGDEVFYAGSITRPGANSEFHAVDERIVALKPRTLDFAASAALPLTALTAWEALFDRLNVSPQGADAGKTVLIIGGAGGVGSIAIQLAKTLAKLHVIATASRPASSEWVRSLGADEVVDHFGDLPAQLRDAGHVNVDYVLIFNDTDHHFPAAAEVIRPQGGICTIVENAKPVPVELLKAKSAAFHWEFMFTRAMFETPDMIEQHRILSEVARLIDDGTLRTTVGEHLGTINAANVRRAHQLLEGGRAIGKLVLSGF